MLNVYFELLLIVLLVLAIYYLMKYSANYSKAQQEINYTKIQMDSNVNEISNLRGIERQYYQLQVEFESFAKLKIHGYSKKVDLDDIRTYIYAYLSKYYFINDSMDSIQKLIDSYLVFYKNDGEFVHLLPADCKELIINPILKHYHESNSFPQLPAPPMNDFLLNLE